LEQQNIYSFTTGGANAIYAWPRVAAINPPSSRGVLQRLHDYLTPPITSSAAVNRPRGRGYDRMLAQCVAEAQRPNPRMTWAYRACARVIREHSKSFYFSARLLPNGKRQGIMALYAFCRLSDDLVDRADRPAAQDPAQARRDAAQALESWAALNHTLRTDHDDAVVAAWADTRLRCSIPRQLADDLISGVRMDLTVDRYDTWDDLWVYCYRVASTVGLMSMYVTGADTLHAVPYAVQLGVALQLTNILRDVGEDARAGRVYLPREDMERFGYTQDMLDAGAVNKEFIALMQFEIGRAHALYEAAMPGIAMLPRDSRVAVGAAAALYRRILDKIGRADYDVFRHRAHLSLGEKLKALPEVWWGARRCSNMGGGL
jgi:phytoene synthase